MKQPERAGPPAGTCDASGILYNRVTGKQAKAGQVRGALQGKRGWAVNPVDVFHMRDGKIDTYFFGHPTPGASTAVPVPQTASDTNVKFHVNALDWAGSAQGLAVHIGSISHTFLNWALGVPGN